MNNADMKKYNILYTTSSGYMMGGGQWSLYYLIKRLNRDIFHPIVICPEDGELAEKMKSVGAEVIIFKIGRIRHLNLSVISKLISIMKTQKVHLVHTDSSTETFYAGISAKINGIPLIWHIRVSEQEWFLDRILSLFSTKIILVAKALSSRFKWLNKTNKLTVIYNGVDIEEFDKFPLSTSIKKEYGIDEDVVTLGCIGRIEEKKAQECLIFAMRHVHKARLLLIGSGEEKYLKRMKDICMELNVSDRIIFAGYRSDIPSILKEIDVLVFPTLSEAFSRVILEAMAAGKPVIATNVGGNSEAVVDGITGYIVVTKDSLRLADRINELVSNKVKREKMGTAGRQRVVEFFTINQNVKKTEEVYLEELENV